jgi:hypothetical protein
MEGNRVLRLSKRPFGYGHDIKSDGTNAESVTRTKRIAKAREISHVGGIPSTLPQYRANEVLALQGLQQQKTPAPPDAPGPHVLKALLCVLLRLGPISGVLKEDAILVSNRIPRCPPLLRSRSGRSVRPLTFSMPMAPAPLMPRS